MIKLHQSYIYAQKVINRKIPAPKYVIKQCEDFLKICEERSEKYVLSETELKQIDNILKLLIMPRGLKAGRLRINLKR